MSPLIGIYASEMSANLWEPQGAYDALASVTVPSGGVASVTFAGIPTGYKHLQVRIIARTNRNNTSDNLYLRVGNGTVDSSANYPGHRLSGDGSTASATAFPTSSGLTGLLAGTTSTTQNTANVFGVSIVDILDYANVNKFKTARTLAGMDTNGSGGLLDYMSAVWLSTSVINIATILPINGTLFTEFSSFALYGVK